ncbi:MAG: hypothetical protein IAG10_30670 [Planctomycetaceae bacterium]|nr:hypothetical protein [Planctomycetaceae bacterium]
MPATKTCIWKREFGPIGPVKTSVFWAVMGALIGFGFDYKDATWPIDAITLAILFAGMGASFRANTSSQECFPANLHFVSLLWMPGGFSCFLRRGLRRDSVFLGYENSHFCGRYLRWRLWTINLFDRLLDTAV